MIEDAMAQELPILHQPEHGWSSRKLVFFGPPAAAAARLPALAADANGLVEAGRRELSAIWGA
jgi:hypothetical protein